MSTQDKLPPLPEPAIRFVEDENGVSVYPDYYTAEQMHEYARAARQAVALTAARVLVKAYRQLNEIRARDGVPYTSMGYASSVDADYFSSVVDEIDAAVVALTGKPAHCHPLLYAANNLREPT